ncbi:MAG: hypothetical protein CL670_17050 [Balneola sp.]|nr:hypothetical protein [Balneola sp.]MBE80871.1 hypothetical protein [Balneola sp.]|tara:strand:- start:23328 stop:25634 length:2307 start_codon:yes stop_codon:yes gene_type:complete
MIKKFCSLLLFSLYFLSVSSQNLESWNVYPSFSTVNSITVDGNTTYAGTLGGIFVVEGNEIVKLMTTLDGLYRSNPSEIIFDTQNNRLFAGYIDGTIDVIESESSDIERVEDIKRVTRFNSKSINAFEIFEGRLYVATSFGIVVYDLENLLVESSFLKLGSADIGAPVNDLDILEGTIYAATTQGIAVGELTSNLVESGNWLNYTEADGLPVNVIQEISVFNGEINALVDESIYVQQNDVWSLNTNFPDEGIQSLQKNNDQQSLAAATSSAITVIDTDQNRITFALDLESNILDLNLDGEQILVGTTNEGLVTTNTGNTELEFYLPTGPYLNFFSKLLFTDEVLIGTSTLAFPRIDPFNLIRGYYIYEDDQWKNYNRNTSTDLSEYSTAFSIGKTDSSYYFGSWGQGIARHNRNSNEISVFDRQNSNLLGIGQSPDFVVISGLDNDTQGNMWAVSFLSDFPLNVQLNGSDDWLPYRSDAGSDLYFDIFIDSFNQKWISLINSSNVGQGLFILDTGDPEDANDDESVKLTSDAGNGNLPDEKVNAIVQDKNGEIWIGTNRGIARFIFPELVIEGGPDERQAQWLINEDTSAVSRFLLRDISVTSMAVNGANQKWVGSVNQGIWVLNDEGSRIINRFTTENSNLISNNINSITIDDESGEVFIATDLGLVSYFEIPKGPVSKMNELKVFPNPFQYSKHTQIKVEGLSESTRIKVLGVDGIVVNELAAQGGRISWDGYDYNGNRIGTGIYFLIAFEESGRETGIGKVVIVK